MTAAALLAGAGLPASGLLFVSAYEAAQRGGGGVHELYWAATGGVLATVAACYHLARDKRRAGAVLAAAVAVVLSLPKLLRAPHYFNFYDELAHWRATQGLVDGAGLFADNPLNKVVADYPGLHALTAALSSTSGGSVFAAGTVVILAARVAGCLAVYLLAERVVRSPAAGLVAVVVFAANPAFGFFDAQFAYESLAAPLVAVVGVLALRSAGDGGSGPWVAGLILALAVVVTHHASSYVLAALLVATAVASARTGAGAPRALVALAVAVPVATLTWLVTAGRHTLTYVAPLVRSNLASVPEFLGGTSRPRRLFAGPLAAPAYEQVAALLAVIVLFGLFLYGAWALLRRWEADDRAAAWVAGLLGLAYFASLPLVALRADQIAKRVWGFAFIGLAPVCAAALVLLVARRPRSGRIVAAALLLVVAVGSGVTRSGEHIRFPGGYLPSADPRSLTPDVVAAARWLRDAHGPDHRVAGDRTLAAALGAYGEQRPVTYQENGRPVWTVFQPERLRPEALTEVERAGLEWVAVDRRAAGVFPLTGFYFDESEPGAYVDTRLTATGLSKFDDPAFRRAYDNGHVVLYQVRR